MENQRLTDFLAANPTPTKEEAEEVGLRPWYNTTGDCIEYQTQQVAIIGDRIDNYLTIYRSAEDRSAVGFQLKDVSELMKRHHSNVFGVAWEAKDKKIISVSSLLITALETDGHPWTIKKRSGYEEAMRNLADVKDNVSLEDGIMA